ncbi:COBRA-like protein 6 isoform X1 [Nicotiana sylvestris]|uniref:COBRA-like protein n=2 Tax=Nicotiana sylvestris TaxID=4096 RepID=A0A1U7WN27_NICSY|nr:PREDICTED: COBRA-like protein 6 isoform X1 [Nicotiana sylvestris]
MSCGLILVLPLILFIYPINGYDPLDPNGNITIKWDIMLNNEGSQDVKVSIFNYQLFRHIDQPGWKLSWSWPGNEVIWDMSGAEATEQGDCSAIKATQPPHCCEKEPVIVDLLPGAPYNKQVANCCKGGVLTSLTQDPEKYGAAFQMNIGSASYNGSEPRLPENFTLGIPGYSCGDPFKVPPSKFNVDQGRRKTQAVATWNVICSYSQFRASSSPTCCVSLSAFYNNTIVPCPKCSCGCQGQLGADQCVKYGELPPVLQLDHNEPPKPVVQCSQHMCPIQIHWHVKQSYTKYWRVKMTIRNLNYVKNYSQWNLVVLHPNLRSVTQVFSFNYKPLNQYGDTNDTGMFYGIEYYNDMLLQAGETGNVQSELLMHKDAGIFTFREGWAFPRKISFNGEDCVLPSPDDYPRLPNSSQFMSPSIFTIIAFFLSLILTIF